MDTTIYKVSQDEYMAAFDKYKHGDLHDQDWVKKIAKTFQPKINILKLIFDDFLIQTIQILIGH